MAITAGAWSYPILVEERFRLRLCLRFRAI